VVVTGRDQQKLDAAVAQLGAGASGAQFDASDQEAAVAFFDGLGRVDHVVLAAGGSTGAGPFSALPIADLRAAVDQKLIAHVISAQAALRVLSKTGSITFVAATSAGAAFPGTAGLAAANGAVVTMVPVLAVELAPIRVNAVSPGVIDTAWWSWLDEEARAATFDSFAAVTPVGRIGNAAEVAHAITYLIEGEFTTGAVLPVDGGSRLGNVA
jgi:NAD(P)-dependent dehydrogenase (short-subunit alcohol dehydrogenase family)